MKRGRAYEAPLLPEKLQTLSSVGGRAVTLFCGVATGRLSYAPENNFLPMLMRATLTSSVGNTHRKEIEVGGGLAGKVFT